MPNHRSTPCTASLPLPLHVAPRCMTKGWWSIHCWARQVFPFRAFGRYVHAFGMSAPLSGAEPARLGALGWSGGAMTFEVAATQAPWIVRARFGRCGWSGRLLQWNAALARGWPKAHWCTGCSLREGGSCLSSPSPPGLRGAERLTAKLLVAIRWWVGGPRVGPVTPLSPMCELNSDEGPGMVHLSDTVETQEEPSK